MGTTHRMAGTVWVLVFAVLVTAAPGAQAPKGPGGPQEGIKVHGDWTLTIKNPDGTIASRHEFKNALVFGGAMTMARLLYGGEAAGRWLIFLHHPDLDPNPRNFHEGMGCTSADQCSINATVSLPSIGPGLARIELRGSAVAIVPMTIGEVTTAVVPCGGGPGDHPCPYEAFSNRTLAAGVQVEQGQTIDVSVVISFS
jgi:hypothetical protein